MYTTLLVPYSINETMTTKQQTSYVSVNESLIFCKHLVLIADQLWYQIAALACFVHAAVARSVIIILGKEFMGNDLE